MTLIVTSRNAYCEQAEARPQVRTQVIMRLFCCISLSQVFYTVRYFDTKNLSGHFKNNNIYQWVNYGVGMGNG